MTGATMVTGADGYLGRRVVSTLLARTDDPLVLAVRAADDTELATKREWAATAFDAAPGRIRVVAADLRQPKPFVDVDPATVRRIVHTAAITRFNVDRDSARQVNLEGTAAVCDFAATCVNLDRYLVLSTLYVSGRHEGPVAEHRLDDRGFVNHYEWSKWAAEERVFGEYAHLPVSVLRLPTVIADDDSGRVTQYNAFHHTLRLFFYGLLGLVPGNPATPLSVTTAAFVSDAVAHLLDDRAPRGVFHVCADPDDTPALGAVIDAAFAVFESDDWFRRRRILRPIYCDEPAFDRLTSAARSMRQAVLSDVLGTVAPFGGQLYRPKTFQTDALRSAWPGCAAPKSIPLVTSTVSHLVRTRWGKTQQEAP
ncbi:SDR family oxidoreductase [Micromonospora sp. HM5-17]|uniref:SDR family oxidoreductase n=1 Tax=Micromonospora sp. HM5-17 TaxID=2487710 RepID=UPI000F4A4F8B|nr:SDR family oxidoreductase [Micromonospora sp. HM5-17]ROT26082.1 NAD-dependent epimerase/dehydratase family protein [Micromonospora sp. HM5-17]